MAKRRVARKPAAKKSPATAPLTSTRAVASSGLPWPVVAILGCLVLIVIMGSIYWFDLFNGSDKMVAKASDKSTSSESKNDKETKVDSENSTDEEGNEEKGGKQEKDDGQANSTGTFDKPFSEQGKDPKSDEPEKKEPEKTETKPPVVSEEKPKDDPKPTAKTPVTPTAKPPVKTPAKPPTAKPEPEPTPKPPAKPVDPFVELADSLNLPEAGAAAGQPVPLAKLFPEADKPVNLSLEGGDTILGEKGKISFVRTPGQPSWKVKLKKSKGEESQIAAFAIQDNQLMFAWMTSGKEPMADQLRNCRLRVATGTKFKRISLRTAQVIEPLLIKIDRGGSQQSFSVPGVPEGASDLQLEIVNLAASFPKHSFVPEPPIAAEGKEVLIKLDAEKVRKVLVLQVRFTKRSGEVSVSARPVLEVPGRGKKKKLMPLNIQQEAGKLQELTGLKDKGMLRFAEVKKTIRDKKKLERMEFEFNQQLAQLDLQISRLQGLAAVYEKVHEKAKLEFRVFVDVGGNQIELLRTSGAIKGEKQPEPEKPAKPTK